VQQLGIMHMNGTASELPRSGRRCPIWNENAMRGCCSCRELHPELSETKIRLDGEAVVASLVGSSVATLGGNVTPCGSNGCLTASIWSFIYGMMEQEGMTKEEALSRRAMEAFEDYGDNALLAVAQDIIAGKKWAGASRGKDITDPTLKDVALALHGVGGESAFIHICWGCSLCTCMWPVGRAPGAQRCSAWPGILRPGSWN